MKSVTSPGGCATLALCGLLLAAAGARGQNATARKSKLDLSQPYLLLATVRVSTLQKEANEAAAVGYRVLTGNMTGGGEPALLMEKVARPPETYAYRVVETYRDSAMQKELDAAARKGFRPVPRAMWGHATQYLIVLEKPPGSIPDYSFRLLGTTLTGTLQKELAGAAEQGQRVAGMVMRQEDAGSMSSQHMVIVEKAAEGGDRPAGAGASNADARQRYRLLATERTSTMQKELNESAAAGYRILAASRTSRTELAMLLEKSQLPTNYEYQLVACARMATLEKELNEVAAKGYRLVPESVVGKRGTKGGWRGALIGSPLPAVLGEIDQFVADEVTAVAEKVADAEGRYRYLVLATERTSTMQKEISQAASEGFKPVAITGRPQGGDFLANVITIMEKGPVR